MREFKLIFLCLCAVFWFIASSNAFALSQKIQITRENKNQFIKLSALKAFGLTGACYWTNEKMSLGFIHGSKYKSPVNYGAIRREQRKKSVNQRLRFQKAVGKAVVLCSTNVEVVYSIDKRSFHLARRPRKTPTPFPKVTDSPKPLPTYTAIATVTAVATVSPRPTNTATSRPSSTATSFPTAIVSRTATSVPTIFVTLTATSVPTAIPSRTSTSVPSATASPSPSPTAPAPTPTNIASPTATPSISPTTPIVVIPELAQWESQMLHYGQIHCQNLANTSLSFDFKLASTYYDAQWVYYQIGDYTGNAYWYNCAQAAEAVYRDGYVVPNGGNIPGYWNFSHGLTRDYLSVDDSNSQLAVAQLSQTAAYTPDWTPLSWTADASMSREVAYAIMSYLNAELVGQPHRIRTELLVEQALAHMSQWFVSQTSEYVRPFMFALTAHALISYDVHIGGDSNVLPAITTGANWIWDNCWIEASQAFKYTDRVVDSGGTEPAPDLNLLIAPVYAWLWHQTGDSIFRDRADKIFAGGVRAAWLVNGKQFNQNYRWSFDYLKWRTVPPLH